MSHRSIRSRRSRSPLYRGTPYAPTKFETAGIVTLGCNIHDDMIAYLVVTDAAWFGRTDRDGHWTASDLPAGEFRVEVWHPRMREKSEVIERRKSLGVPESGELDVTLTRTLRPEPLGRRGRERLLMRGRHVLLADFRGRQAEGQLILRRHAPDRSMPDFVLTAGLALRFDEDTMTAVEPAPSRINDAESTSTTPGDRTTRLT